MLEAPSASKSAGLGGGVCMREPDALRLLELDERLLTKLKGRPSSASRSLLEALKENEKFATYTQVSSY